MHDQLSKMRGLFALSMMMANGSDEEEILRLAISAVWSLGPFQVLASYLLRNGRLVRSPHTSAPPLPLDTQVEALAGREALVTVPDQPWARAYPLPSLSGHRGCLVIASETEPSDDEQVLLTVLAQQTGAALAGASLQRQEREHALQLQSLTEQLESVITELEHRTKIHEALAKALAARTGEDGIARAMHEFTGLSVAVEDPFGNLRAWAGPGRPTPYPRPPAQPRSEVLRRAQREGHPVRDKDRLIALAQPGSQVLGVLALVDPDRTAAPHHVLALEQGATALAAELAHQHDLAEMELRLRGDLVEDLLTGADNDSAVARAQALGHDLQRPHRVLVVHELLDQHTDETLLRAVERAAASLQMNCLLGKRSGTAVLVVQRPLVREERLPWKQLHAAVSKYLRSANVAIGVGGRYEQPSDAPASWQEAVASLDVRRKSRNPAGVTVWDELGIYRILTALKDDDQIQMFIRDWLGPLLDYDSDKQTDLVKTLSVYLECGGNYDQAAEELHIARSTLRYRLKRIRQITGFRLDDADTHLNLHMATRAWAILEGSS
ncbi:PucR family transcriptional regulator [Pseudonocardia sp. H11422]|uniref:PucR family transcriptional regulator n=1 Tax=Pseudonocardia sp. H11422 TaxID=2835866 RepID=UPI001BDD67DC|nr:helix-turn-helix domain-containing protein [Pseudonocardia sp. H11422]